MQIRQWFIGIAAVCTLWGCSRSEMNGTPAGQPSEEGKMAVTLELGSDTPLKAADPDSKANATENATDETLVSNIVVLQYDMRNDEGQLVGMQFVDGVTQSGSNIQVSVSLEPLRKTRVVVLANMNGFLDSEQVTLGSSLEALNNLTYDISSTAGTGIPNDYNTTLPMRAESGDITLTEGQVDRLTLTLYRLVAKVNFYLYNLCQDKESGKYFEVSSVTLKNVPTVGTYERVTETSHADQRYPVLDARNFKNYATLAGDKFTEQTTACLWYMAPNNGGTGKGTTALDKMDPANVPSNFCSYVEVNGNIHIADTPYPVSYRLYLGRNNTNDYNVWANEAYTVDLIIRSLPDDPGEIPETGFDGFRIEMQATQMHNSTVIGWAPGIQNVSVSPSPKTIPHSGGDYTVTLSSTESWGNPMPVRVWDGKETVDQGSVTYNEAALGGSIILSIPENNTQATRPLTFQLQWNDTWITFDGGTQFSTSLGTVTVSPDPLSIPYQGNTYTISFNGVWNGSIPVRIWNATTNSEIASGSVNYDGDHNIDLAVPENGTNQVYSIDFQYQWEGEWATIRTGLQHPKAYVTTASVSPDPTTIPATGNNYIVTLNGLWAGSAEIRAWDGTSELASSTAACIMNGNSGSGTTSLTIPANNASGAVERTIIFQYRLSDGEWTDIDQGVQKASEVTAATVSPDPSNGISAYETQFTVTLTGIWKDPVPVRAIDQVLPSNPLATNSVSTSGMGVTLTVPANTSNARTVVFQYQWNGEWVEIDRGVQDYTTKLTPLPLTDAKMANSAMVVPNSGQSGAAVFSLTKLAYGWTDELPGTMRAEVLWQDAPNVLRNTDITLDRNAQTITIRSSLPVEGNAVVALYNSDEAGKGEILWTWHIWVTSYRPEGTKNYELGMNSKATVTGGQVHTYGTQYWAVNPNKVIMDRNLGARQASYANPGNNDSAMKTWGNYYQYGRKDPFPSGSGVGSSAPATLYGATGTQLTQGFKSVLASSVDKNGTALEYAVKNPLTFLYNRTNWYSGSQNTALWGTIKTAYDPCPAGWKVAPDGTWGDFNSSTFKIGGSEASWGAVYSAGDCQAWFPGIGSLNWETGHYRFVGGPYAYYWLVTDNNAATANNLYYTSSGQISPSTGHARADGFIVRCVQE